MKLFGFEIGIDQPLFLIAGRDAGARSLGTCDRGGISGPTARRNP